MYKVEGLKLIIGKFHIGIQTNTLLTENENNLYFFSKIQSTKMAFKLFFKSIHLNIDI